MQWTELYGDLAEWAVAIVWGLTLVLVVPWIKAKVASIKDQHVRMIVGALVTAAEQKYGSGKGEEKFRWVVEKAAQKGLRLDEADIEAEVYRLTGRPA